MTGPRIGELFAGYGGLGQGVQAVLGGEIAWFSEFDKAPSKILAHHWPDVPNHGDITLIDWSTVEPVDILTGGFPCQDVSLAGARRGLKDGTRSGLWSYFAEAIGALKPELVVIENVRGLLSADASSGVESCPECVGDGPDAVSLRALGAVLGDLADIGYDAEWAGVRAADAGAPHGRFRVFVLAYPNDHKPNIPEGTDGPRDLGAVAGWGVLRTRGCGDAAQNADLAHANPANLGHERGRRTRDRGAGSADSREFATDPSGDESERRGRVSNLGSATLTDEGSGQERQRIRDTVSDCSAVAADTTGCRCNGGTCEQVGCTIGRTATARGSENTATAHNERVPIRAGQPGARNGAKRRTADLATMPTLTVNWGDYEPAIRRWEAVTGRPAPAPTNGDGKNGSHRLSACFVEWMMGLDDGHVTDVGLTRNEQLKALGNGVVPQQAEMALRVLLSRMSTPTMKGAA